MSPGAPTAPSARLERGMQGLDTPVSYPIPDLHEIERRRNAAGS